MNATQFTINQLRMTNIQKLLEGLVVLLGAIFVSALLPSLLFQFIYANQALTQNPAIIEYMPAVVFGFGILYLLYIVAGITLRGKQIVRLEQELLLSAGDANSMSDDAELKELEALVDQALASQDSGSAKAAKKSTRRRTTRRSSKK